MQYKMQCKNRHANLLQTLWVYLSNRLDDTPLNYTDLKLLVR